MKFHFPPRFDLKNRKQLWFIEGTRVDDLVNGIMTAVVVFATIAAVGGVLH